MKAEWPIKTQIFFAVQLKCIVRVQNNVCRDYFILFLNDIILLIIISCPDVICIFLHYEECGMQFSITATAFEEYFYIRKASLSMLMDVPSAYEGETKLC